MNSLNTEVVEVRPLETRDLSHLYKIFVQVNLTGGQFPWLASTSEEEFQTLWTQKGCTSYVATVGGKVAGGYSIRAQWPGRGSHVATGVYMVSPEFRGQRLGFTLGQHSQVIAKELGFLAMQYNLVVSKNHVGLSLWKKLGFEIIGTLPEAYRHETEGLVDAYVMHRFL